MMASLYPLTFIIASSFLIAWTYFNYNKLWTKFWQAGFLLSMLVYLGSFLVGSGSMEDKFAWLFRDMMIMGGIGLVFQFLVRSTGAFVVGLFLTIGGFVWMYETFSEAVLIAQLQSDIINENSQSEIIEETAQLDFVNNQNFSNEGEWLVELAPGLGQQDLADLLSDYQVTISRAFEMKDEDFTELDDYFLLDVINNEVVTIQEIAEILNQSDFVDWFEANEEISVAPVVSTPQKTINPKFQVNDPDLEQLWGFEAMNVDLLYDLIRDQNIKPKKKALIAILDTGVDAKHEDLRGNYQTTQAKYDRDTKMHGTHCAGIAAAVSNNGVGIASFSPNRGFVKITSIKVLSDFGIGTQQSIINGMLEAADKGADVISMSLGGRSNQSRQTAYRKAVEYVNKKGAIVVAAAGNSNMDAKGFSPVNAPGLIGVSAIDDQLNRASFSNFVPNIKMAVAAPGVNIYSTTPNNTYASFNGTSMATPYVAGLVGLMKSLKPNLTAKEAHKILAKSGVNTKDTKMTGKLIQPYAAVQELLK